MIGVNLTVSLAVETIQTKPACAGYKTLDKSVSLRRRAWFL
jgi:hypothetical protein